MTNLKLTVALVGSCLLITAPAASADVVYHYHYAYQWQINRVSAPYQTQTGWHFCAQSHGGTVTCSRAFTVANSVTGQIGVSDGVLSATLGFNVTKSTTTTGGATYKVPRRRLGVAEWRSLFSTQAVHQCRYRRNCTQFGCFGTWQPRNHYQTAYASRYTGPDFREVIR